MDEIYLTREGDMVDAICYKYYPNAYQDLALRLVYEANYRLTDYGAHLPAGLKLVLPDLPTPNVGSYVNIWD